jgi:uncharacterized RmlC-like cupin family protein
MDRDNEVIAIPADELSDDTAQTEGLPRLAGVSAETTGASSIWMGRPTGEPGMDSGPHHHGEAETAGYVLSGESRIYYGEAYDEYVDLGPGDFVYVPPFLPHVERNRSDTEPVEFVTARSPDNIVVNLDDDPDI